MGGKKCLFFSRFFGPYFRPKKRAQDGPFWPKWPLKWATTRPEKAAARLFLPQCAPHTTPGGWAPVWGRSGDYSGKSLFHAGGLGGPAILGTGCGVSAAAGLRDRV